MIKINGRKCRLCLLDTNVLSEMLKNPRQEFRTFLTRFLSEGWVPAFSLFTIFEIRQRDPLFALFIEYFSTLPCVFLKGHEQLLSEELDHYPDPSSIDPILLSPMGIQPPRKQALEHYFTQDFVLERERYWNAEKDEILAEMVGLVDNFPPKGGKYTDTMILEFVETNVFQQVAMRDLHAARRFAEGPAMFDSKAFPSVRMMALTVFFKFYPDRRRPTRSDVFDVVIAAPTPYVDGVITERHHAETLRKAKRIESCLKNVEIFTLHDLRK